MCINPCLCWKLVISVTRSDTPRVAGAGNPCPRRFIRTFRSVLPPPLAAALLLPRGSGVCPPVRVRTAASLAVPRPPPAGDSSSCPGSPAFRTALCCPFRTPPAERWPRRPLAHLEPCGAHSVTSWWMGLSLRMSVETLQVLTVLNVRPDALPRTIPHSPPPRTSDSSNGLCLPA